jgi:hypothetical protein
MSGPKIIAKQTKREHKKKKKRKKEKKKKKRKRKRKKVKVKVKVINTNRSEELTSAAEQKIKRTKKSCECIIKLYEEISYN